MKNTFTYIYGISAALLLSGSAAQADSARTGQLPSPDSKFVQDAVAGGRTEVQLGQMASQKGGSPMVQEFGTRMAQDHSTANQQLGRILTEQGITEPVPTEKTAKMTDQLQNMNGPDFDRAYMRDMVKDHKNDIAEFKKRSGQRPGSGDKKLGSANPAGPGGTFANGRADPIEPAQVIRANLIRQRACEDRDSSRACG